MSEAIETLHRVVSPHRTSPRITRLWSRPWPSRTERRGWSCDREIQCAHCSGRVRSADGPGNGMVVVRRHVRLPPAYRERLLTGCGRPGVPEGAGIDIPYETTPGS